jgi:hypothetical protein
MKRIGHAEKEIAEEMKVERKWDQNLLQKEKDRREIISNFKYTYKIRQIIKKNKQGRSRKVTMFYLYIKSNQKLKILSPTVYKEIQILITFAKVELTQEPQQSNNSTDDLAKILTNVINISIQENPKEITTI